MAPTVVPVEKQPGDVHVHGVMVVHGSEAVVGNRMRRANDYQFCAAGQILSEGPWDAEWVDERLRSPPLGFTSTRQPIRMHSNTTSTLRIRFDRNPVETARPGRSRSGLRAAPSFALRTKLTLRAPTAVPGAFPIRKNAGQHELGAQKAAFFAVKSVDSANLLRLGLGAFTESAPEGGCNPCEPVVHKAVEHLLDQ